MSHLYPSWSCVGCVSTVSQIMWLFTSTTGHQKMQMSLSCYIQYMLEESLYWQLLLQKTWSLCPTQKSLLNLAIQLSPRQNVSITLWIIYFRCTFHTHVCVSGWISKHERYHHKNNLIRMLFLFLTLPFFFSLQFGLSIILPYFKQYIFSLLVMQWTKEVDWPDITTVESFLIL